MRCTTGKETDIVYDEDSDVDWTENDSLKVVVSMLLYTVSKKSPRRNLTSESYKVTGTHITYKLFHSVQKVIFQHDSTVLSMKKPILKKSNTFLQSLSSLKNDEKCQRLTHITVSK